MIFDIPSLRDDRLGTQIPTAVYGGGPVYDSEQTLYVFRTCTFPATAHRGTLAFYIDDARFEAVWNQREAYAERFASFGWASLVECDFSLWRDDALIVQAHNVYRARALARLWQEHGLHVIPSLNWSDERSYDFAFCGVPVGAPVCMVEARTPASTEDDRRAFLAGLAAAVQRVRPGNVVIYGGQRHEAWLRPALPEGPAYTLLESWSAARSRWLTVQRRRQKDENQMKLFPPGGEKWADAEVSV
jgi:hypothetical protein